MNTFIFELMVKTELKNKTSRSAWSKGVAQYADELIQHFINDLEDGYFDPEDLQSSKLIEKALLNGAENWEEYSWGGSALIYDSEIAERLCNPTELKRTHNGDRRPNAREEWLDTQARALFQAAELVKSAITTITH